MYVVLSVTEKRLAEETSMHKYSPVYVVASLLFFFTIKRHACQRRCFCHSGN